MNLMNSNSDKNKKSVEQKSNKENVLGYTLGLANNVVLIIA